MPNNIRYYLNILFFFIALFIVATTAYMTVVSYTPIPFWDSWLTQKAFVRRLFSSSGLSESIGLMLEQHNEHRIVLARILVLVDELLFEGKSAFLFLMNLIIPLLFLIFIFKMIKLNYVTLIFAIGLVFSFEQWENFTWALQSQFFIAVYVPFIGYVLISRQNTNLLNKYALIFLFSLISPFTLVSGVFFAIPLIIYFIAKDRDVKSTLVALFSFGLVIILNFFVLDYSEVGHHGGLKDVPQYNLNDIVLIFVYVINYFSSLFSNFISLFSESLRGVAGLLFIILYVLCLFVSRGKPDCPTSRAMSLFILFYIVWAFATAIGRARFGAEQALSSRYTTPTAIAWLSLAIFTYNLFVRDNEVIFRIPARIYQGTVAVLILILAFSQIKTTNEWPWDDQKHRNELSMLAMALDVGESDLTYNLFSGGIFPRQEFARQQARGDKAILDGEWFDLADKLGLKVNPPASRCAGQIEAINPIKGGYKVTGWIIAPKLDQISVLNSRNEVVGVGLIGGRREDVEEAYPRTGRYSGFTALIKDELVSETIEVNSIRVAVEQGKNCALYQDS